MKHAHPNLMPSLVAIVAIGVSFAAFVDVAHAQATSDRAAQLGAALPGGAIVSARSVAVAPAAGGAVTAAPIGADGTFRVTGLAPGAYRLAITSTSVKKQTQGATFGEKVNAGLQAAGSAIQQGASLKQGDMPNRISMNVTTPKQTRRLVVDETVMDVEVSADGVLQGRVAAP